MVYKTTLLNVYSIRCCGKVGDFRPSPISSIQSFILSLQSLRRTGSMLTSYVRYVDVALAPCAYRARLHARTILACFIPDSVETLSSPGLPLSLIIYLTFTSCIA